MKQLLFSMFLFFIMSVAMAQDMKKAKKYMDNKELDKAKTEIEGILAKKPDDAEALYMKAKVYVMIAASDQYKGLVTEGDPRDIAFEIVVKALNDSNNAKLTLMAAQDQYKALCDLYSDFYSQGAEAFNNASQSGEKARYEDAMNYFIKSNNVGQYIVQRNLAKIGEVDTTLVLNIGKAALNAKKEDLAMKYFQMLADAKINGTSEGNTAGFQIPYQYLTLHYKNANDEENMMKYASLGKELFPEEDYFTLVEMDYYRENKNQEKLFTKYDELVAKNPDSLAYHFNYANDIFGYLYNSDAGTVINNKQALINTLGQRVESAYKIDPNDVNNNWLYGQYFYNLGIEYRDSANRAKDAAAKTGLQATANENFKKAIPYGDKALTTLEGDWKKSDKSRYKSITDLMQKIHQSLNQNDQVKVYQTKYDNADAKFEN
ncbi:hypothetical protein BH20BAC1_BH20BAC1_04120 [soil metagenome]